MKKKVPNQQDKQNKYTLILSKKADKALRDYKALYKKIHNVNITYSKIINNSMESKTFKNKYKKLNSKYELELEKKLKTLKDETKKNENKL